MVGKPLSLKREVIAAPTGPLSEAIASIWVDSQVFHLDQPFTYAIPKRLQDEVEVGTLVEVEFHGRLLQGLVTSVQIGDGKANLFPIKKSLSPIPLLNRELIQVIEDGAHRWVGNPFDFLRIALPHRVQSVEREFLGRKRVPKSEISQGLRRFIHLKPRSNPYSQLAQLIEKAAFRGGVLVVVPQDKEIDWLSNELEIDHICISSKDRKSENYRKFLSAQYSQNPVVIGNRSAILMPIANLQTIIIFRDSDESHYEIKAPGWNTRDLALLRSRREKFDLLFVGFSPSSDLMRLIDERYVDYLPLREKIEILQSQPSSELIPSRIFKEVRNSLQSGSILFLVPKRGYADAIMCAKCHNISLCKCGGKLRKGGAKTDISCSLCEESYPDWSCQCCHGRRTLLLARGSDHIAQEIGRSFPGYPVVISTAATSTEATIASQSLVIATSGAIPPGRFALTVILNGDNFFASSDLRGTERALESFFNAAGRSIGKVAIIIDSQQRILKSLTKWSPFDLLMIEMKSHEKVGLPPFYRAIVIETDQEDSSSILRGFEKSLRDNRLPNSTKIFGTKGEDDGRVRIVLSCRVDQSQKLIDFIYELQRRRSISKKSLFRIRIDPYSLQ